MAVSSCTLDGVKPAKSNTKLKQGDTSVTLVEKDTTESMEVPVEEVKADTIDGKVNQMVWMNDRGLRIEWKIKKDNNPLISGQDAIMVNYEARVARGDVYDSNTALRKPVPLKLGMGQLIEGWETGLLQMHPGDVGRIMIPSALAYGEQGYLGKIPQNADIIVEIEIVKIIEPIVLEEGVKVFIYENGDTTNNTPQKNQNITFDYFAYKKGKTPGIYDNSFKNGTPFTIQHKNYNIIDGLHQGFDVLRAGDNAFIDIPAKLAYGSKGLLDMVPPNTDVVYDVRIKEIK